MMCSFVYKEKCQAPEKIPRTTIVTHDKTEHVKFFWRLGLGLLMQNLTGFSFSSSEEVTLFHHYY